MKSKTLLCSLATTVIFIGNFDVAAALSSVGYPESRRSTTRKTLQMSNLGVRQQDNAFPTSSTTTTHPWRIVVDVGREPLSSMPFDWARSGCRMPLKVNCDVMPDGLVVPQQETVTFTGPDGAVYAPIKGGEWKIRENKNYYEWSLTLEFPEKLQRRDVTIDAGSVMKLTGSVFSQTQLNKLNQEFYQAREEAWELGGALNEFQDQKEAPKKWNEDTKQWEQRYNTNNPSHLLGQASKRIMYLKAKAKQTQKNNERPDPQTLSSERGPFPGIDTDVYVQKGGTVSIAGAGGWRGDAVAGTWWAEPITGKPASYRS